MSDDLIATARRLARSGRQRPRQADLTRAVSTSYYAAFHALARDCADVLAGAGQARSDGAWTQVYRSLEHGAAKNACKQAANLRFPSEILAFARAFVELQEERHRADYDPNARYTRAETSVIIANAEKAIASLRSASRQDRRAFAISVLLKRR